MLVQVDDALFDHMLPFSMMDMPAAFQSPLFLSLLATLFI